MEEGRALQRIGRTSKDPVRLRRAIVVLMSAQGQSVRDITSLLQVGEDYVRDVIHAFNERGFDEVELVFLPTYGSWLNWIESEFAALRYFALNGTDHRSHDEQNAAAIATTVVSASRWRALTASSASATPRTARARCSRSARKPGSDSPPR
jgi:hypothetical protein